MRRIQYICSFYKLAVHSEQVDMKNTEPTGELFDLMASVGAIGENQG